MDRQLDLKAVFIPSEDIVAREIEGEIVIVPLVAGIGDTDDELYTLNETGQAIWRLLDGKRTLGHIAEALAGEFDAPLAELETEVLGFVEALTKRRILSELPSAS